MTEDLKIEKINEKDVLLSYDLTQFSNLLDLMNACNTEHRLHFAPEGLTIKTVDPANTLMEVIELPAGIFQKYNINSTFEVGFPVTPVLDILKIAFYQKINLGNSLEITSIESKVDTRSNSSKGQSTFIFFKAGPLSFSVKAISLGCVRAMPKEPEINYIFSFSVGTEELYNAVKLFYQISAEIEHIKFTGTRLSNLRDPNYAPDEGNLDNLSYFLQYTHVIDTEEPIPSSNFSREYLSAILKPLRDIAEFSVISLKTDYPIKISAEGRGEERITLLLAPRLNSP